MRIVVTGALGHIGSRLIRDLPAAFPHAEIVMLDNLATQRYCSLFNLPGQGRYRFLEADVLEADLEAIFAAGDTVVHLAAITNATASFENKDQVERVNLIGAERVARACIKVGSALIFPSTTSVYGTQAETVDENCALSDLRPQSPYADSKLRAERLLAELGKAEGLRFVICRLGTIFGVSSGMRFHTAINKFCWQAVLGQPITVWRTALNQKRPYLDLRDCAEAIKFIIRKALFDNGIYNIVTVNSTVGDIVEAIKAHVPDLTVQLVDSAIMNQLSYNVDNSCFQKHGFIFAGNLERGIAETIQLLKPVQWGGGEEAKRRKS
ncbi:MAG: SDR family oxidoreductase [Gammaproteobacteria bacterium]|nr:SDR family oxidoreductase [Gammaproteobacteria bacterium]